METQTKLNPIASSDECFDFIVVGGGIGGTVVASRLHQRNPSLSILLIEAGPDSSKTSLAEVIASLGQVRLLRHSEVDWDYETVPQKHLNGAKMYVGAGKALGGGSVINYGLWTRGDSKDYENWAELVGDERWSWQGFLPYFCKIEHHYDPQVSSKEHGHNGPIHTASVSSSGRNFPLREPIKAAWSKLGVQTAADINDGHPLGVAEIVESRSNGRVIASDAYSLEDVTVITSSIVKRVVITTLDDGTKVATGVELTTGQEFAARKEVILCAGALRTPQLLLLSGIGPSDELNRHGIHQTVDSPEVGKNLWDHLVLLQQWKLRHPEIGASFGSPNFNDPAFMTGNLMDWWTTVSVPVEELKVALSHDLGASVSEHLPLLKEPRCHLGCFVHYTGLPPLPVDGTRITTFALNLLPTSRGTITLASSNPEENPLIDHNHYATEADRYRLRAVVRLLGRFMETEEGKEMVSEEVVPAGLAQIGLESTDQEIDERVKVGSGTLQHPAGSASMGKVVDTQLRVIGVKGLRIVDASVIPTPISCPIQACVYALGEQAVDLILSSHNN